MSGEFRTDLSTMQTAAQHVADVNSQIQTQLSNLQNRLAPLAGSWQGQGASTFQALMERWQEDASKLSQALGQIQEGLVDSHRTYDTTDAAVQQDFGQVQSRLG